MCTIKCWNRRIMKASANNLIKGKHFAITGALVFYKRKDAFDLIRYCGGIPQLNVTKETDYLVVGYYRRKAHVGFKSRKRVLAERYIGLGQHIKIIKEEDFLPMLWFSQSNCTGCQYPFSV